MGMTATADPPDTRRFTAAEVWRMFEIGLLGEDEPYELLDGELVYVSPQGERHAKVITRLKHVLRCRVRTERSCRALLMGGIGDSIPEPDLTVVTVDVAEAGRPEPGQAVLLVEVAAASQPRDRRKGVSTRPPVRPSFGSWTSPGRL